MKKRKSKKSGQHHRDKDLDAYQIMVNSYIAQGIFTQEDLADPEYIEYHISEDIREGIVKLVIDHRDDLLEKAKYYQKKGSNNYAILFYALFFEHSINGLISLAMQRKKLSANAKMQLIRSANILAKFTWVLELLDLPAFKSKHFKCVMRASELRNAFVHYKFVGVSIDDDRDDDSLEEFLQEIRKTATYMKRYESRVLYSGEKSNIRKKVKTLRTQD